MTRKKLLPGVLLTVLVFGMAVLSACASTAYTTLERADLPDNKSAIVYFIGNSNCGAVWDGEVPVGDFLYTTPRQQNMQWITTPGIHYFMANTFNWITMKANLEPNKSYYVKIETIPNPLPFGRNFIALRVLTPDDGEKWLKQAKIISFTEEWRNDYAKGKESKEAQEQLQKAKSDATLGTTLTGKDGR